MHLGHSQRELFLVNNLWFVVDLDGGWRRPLVLILALVAEGGVVEGLELEMRLVRFFEFGTSRGPKGLLSPPVEIIEVGTASDLTSVLILMGDVEAGGVGGCKLAVD